MRVYTMEANLAPQDEEIPENEVDNPEHEDVEPAGLPARPSITVGRLISPIFEQYNDCFQDAMSQVAESVYAVTQNTVLQATKALSELASEAIQRREDEIRRYVQQIVDTIQPLREFFDRLEEYHIAEAEALEVLRRYRWLPFRTMPMTFMIRIINVSRQPGNKTGAINKLYATYFLANDCKNLVEMVENWADNPLFAPRMRIFRDCVKAVREAKGKYNAANVVLPALIAQIDGILTDFGARKGVPNPGARDGRGDNQPEGDFAKWLQQHTQDGYYADLGNDLLLNCLFHLTRRRRDRKPIEPPYRYNRHKVLHGQYIHYGKMPDLLRTFLVLDYLEQFQ